MAIINNKSTGKYGVVHTTNMDAVRTGKMRAQSTLDATDFATKKAENGMLLAVDDFTNTIKLPTNHATTNIYLNASEIINYEGKGEAYSANELGGILPKMLKPAVEDKFETNSFEWDSTTYANYAAVVAAISASAVYGETNASGNIRLVATATVGAVTELKAIEPVTLPTGDIGLKFVVNKIG